MTARTPHHRLAAVAALGAALLTAACTSGTADDPAAPPVGNGSPVTAAREQVLDVGSPWNDPVTDAAADPRSAGLLRASLARAVADRDGSVGHTAADPRLRLGTASAAVPVVAGGDPTTLRCRQVRCGDATEVVVDVPPGIDPDPLHEGWLSVFDHDAGLAYDLWRARREDDGTISYATLRSWALDGPGFSQPYVVGARGSGLPLFAGLVRPGELDRGQVGHALAITLPATAAGRFVAPASATDGTDATGAALPQGARLRLRADAAVELPAEPVARARATALVQALREYGAIVVGQSALPTVQVQRTDDPVVLTGRELLCVGLDDFVVVDLRDQRRYAYPATDHPVAPSPIEQAG